MSSIRQAIKPTPLDLRARRLKVADRLLLVCAVSCVVAALISLVGWVAGIYPHVAAAAGGPPITPGVALYFMALAGAILLLRERAPARLLSPGLVATFAKWLPPAIALSGLVLYVVGFFVAFDPLIISGGTGLIFALLGGALVFRRKRPWIAFSITVFWFAFLFVILLWYTYSVTSLFPVGVLPTMAAASIFLFLALLIGLLLLDVDRRPLRVFIEESPAGALTRTLLPVAIVAVALFGYLRIQGQLSGMFDTTTGTTLYASSIIGLVVILTGLSARSMGRVEERRLAAEREVKVAEDRFQRMFHASPVAMTLSSMPEGRYVDVNEAAAKLFNVAREQALGKTSTELNLIDEEARQKVIANLSREGRLNSVEIPFRGKNGTPRTVLTSIEPMELSGGKMVLSVFVDITDRKRAEQALANSKATLAEAQRIGHVGSWEWDVVADKATWSDEMFRIFGLDPSQPAANLAKAMTMMHPEDREKFASDVEEAVRGPNPYSSEYRIVRADGQVRFLAARGEATRDANGRAVHMVGAVHDLTERKLAEDEVIRSREEIQAKNAELQRSNSELEQFAYVASHDLQEPLRMVASYVQLIERRYKGKLDEDADDFIKFAVEGANRMQLLIQDLLVFSRVGSRGKELEATPLNESFNQSVENLGMAIEDAQATVKCGQLPTARADPGQMVQLFQNLIGNAIKFHGKAPPVVEVTGKSVDGWCEITVKDNGIGIDPKYFDRIFVIFQRLHSREEYAGTGIGLAVCRRIVDRHGGRIWVESAEGQGSAFHFTLPSWDKTGGTRR